MNKIVVFMLLVLFPTFALGIGSTPTPQTAQRSVKANGALVIYGTLERESPIKTAGDGRLLVCTDWNWDKSIWTNIPYGCNGKWITPKEFVESKYPKVKFVGIAVSSGYLVIYYQVPE